jgi:hypothetical protein
MSPDEIHSFLSEHYPKLHAVRRHNPDGWSFFLGAPQTGSNSNRIIRATRSGQNATTRLKLAVTSRHKATQQERGFSGDHAALRSLVDTELQLFKKLFAQDKRP